MTTTVAFSPSSCSNLSISPSIIHAVPMTQPDCILSIEFVPMIFFGAAMSICGSKAAPAVNALMDVFTPVVIVPPKKLPSLSSTEPVVAVPKSKMIVGCGYFSFASDVKKSSVCPEQPYIRLDGAKQ